MVRPVRRPPLDERHVALPAILAGIATQQTFHAEGRWHVEVWCDAHRECCGSQCGPPPRQGLRGPSPKPGTSSRRRGRTPRPMFPHARRQTGLTEAAACRRPDAGESNLSMDRAAARASAPPALRARPGRAPSRWLRGAGGGRATGDHQPPIVRLWQDDRVRCAAAASLETDLPGAKRQSPPAQGAYGAAGHRCRGRVPAHRYLGGRGRPATSSPRAATNSPTSAERAGRGGSRRSAPNSISGRNGRATRPRSA